MAQLKDTIISGSLRATDTVYTNTLQAPTFKAFSSSTKTAYGPGTNGQVLQSDGSNIYWGTISMTDTATAVDNILDGSNSGTAITYAPYTSQQSKLSFDTSSTTPSRTDRLNLNGYFYATRVYNAVWNDYAEFRTTYPEAKCGQCVIDNDDGSLAITNKRLLPGAQIISDTYGSAMGETPTAKTPLAVAGRVLAYPYQARENYHAGMAVCSAPNGTVDIMTRDEIKNYPDCIIGIVSEIPKYEKWGTNQINVDGRIWIKIK